MISLHHLEPGLDIAAELLAVDRDVVLGHPVGVEDGAAEGDYPVYRGEVLEGGLVDVVDGPLALGVEDEAVVEEAERLVRPQPDQLLDRHRLQRTDRLADAPHPPAVAEYIRKGK